MTRLSVFSTLKFLYKLPSLFIINIDNTIFACSNEAMPVGLVVAAEELVNAVALDLIELLARGGVVVREGAVGVGGDHHVFGDAGRVQGAPAAQVRERGLTGCPCRGGLPPCPG
jgi:hypothetical protein